jgi:hypothetical protein
MFFTSTQSPCAAFPSDQLVRTRIVADGSKYDVVYDSKIGNAKGTWNPSDSKGKSHITGVENVALNATSALKEVVRTPSEWELWNLSLEKIDSQNKFIWVWQACFVKHDRDGESESLYIGLYCDGSPMEIRRVK